MAKRESFRDRLGRIASGDASDVLVYPVRTPVMPGRRYHITALSFEDETNACTEVQVSVNRGGTLYREFEERPVVAGETYNYHDDIVLSDGERLHIYFSGATARDILSAWLRGWWTEEVADA